MFQLLKKTRRELKVVETSSISVIWFMTDSMSDSPPAASQQNHTQKFLVQHLTLSVQAGKR